jgi:integrase
LIDPVRDLVSPQVRAMIDLQLLTGARPGELCRMRSCDVDTTPAVWVYRPESHKTAHHGHRREIFIGPKAQRVLRPLLKPDLQAYVFSPADAERARAEKLREARKTPVQPSQQRRAERAKRRRRRRAPTDRYDVAAYRRAIARACARAFPPPEHLARRKGETANAWRARLTVEQRVELKRWADEHSWHPHQLRHNAATRLRREYGLEAAQVILGHKTLAVTEIYAEKNVAKAREIMGAVG